MQRSRHYVPQFLFMMFSLVLGTENGRAANPAFLGEWRVVEPHSFATFGKRNDTGKFYVNALASDTYAAETKFNVEESFAADVDFLLVMNLRNRSSGVGIERRLDCTERVGTPGKKEKPTLNCVSPNLNFILALDSFSYGSFEVESSMEGRAFCDFKSSRLVENVLYLPFVTDAAIHCLAKSPFIGPFGTTPPESDFRKQIRWQPRWSLKRRQIFETPVE